MSILSLKNTVRKAATPVSCGVRADVPVCMLKQTARRAAEAAGEMLMRRFRGARKAHRIDDHDVKLDVDRLSEKIITATIRKTFPDHGILGEESGASGGGRRGTNGSSTPWTAR